MGKLAEILELAKARGENPALPYAGAVTPAEAHTLLQLAPGARLVDVRTHAEWVWVGRVPGAVEIEWQSWPEGRTNLNFMAQLRQQVDQESLVLFLCRSGVRSHHAAALAASAGWASCYNILEGFEGDKDASGQRGKIGGWRHAGLPWTN
ncbi:MAG: rhodanese-like domain-containing protein [Zoogloeaceae bacterium]|nr:rhodanese-like domain-containing protein [Zoogloeaceae bacterium]